MRTAYNIVIMFGVGLVIFGVCVPIFLLFTGQKFSQPYVNEIIRRVEYFEDTVLLRYWIYDIISTVIYIFLIYYYEPFKTLL